MQKETLTQLQAENADILLLDIREAEELDSVPTAEGATHMPMGKVFTEASKDNLPKDKHIIVFCRTGGRASVVERELRERGYHIDSIEGGIEALKSD